MPYHKLTGKNIADHHSYGRYTLFSGLNRKIGPFLFVATKDLCEEAKLNEDEVIEENTESFVDASGMIVELYGWNASDTSDAPSSATSKSYIKQIISLRHDSAMVEFHTLVNWRENRKLLKVLFPINVRNDFATYEMQCGLVIYF